MSINSAQSPSKPLDVDASIGRRVHQLMWDRQITQTAFGVMVGMDQSSVAKRFRGKLGWSATQVQTAAAALNTTVAYLFGETWNPAPVGPDGLEPPTSSVKTRGLATVHPIRKAS